MTATTAAPTTSAVSASGPVVGGSARNVRTDSVSSVHSAVGSTSTSSPSPSPFDRTGSQAAIFRSSNITGDQKQQQQEMDTETTNSDQRSPAFVHHERINPFDKNKPTAATASSSSTTANTSTTFAGRTSSYDRSSVTSATQVVQKQPSTTSSTSSTTAAAADYSAPKYTATKSYARTDSAYRRDFRSNSISAHSEYSSNKPTAGLSGSPLYSTLEEQPRPRPAAATAVAAAAAVTPPPVTASSQSSRSDAYTASKFTRSIGSFSDAELIFGSPAASAAAGSGSSTIGGAASDRFSSSTDSGAVFRSSGGSLSQSSQDTPERRSSGQQSQQPTYKIYDGIQNHAFQDYDSGPVSSSLPASREEDDEYDLK